MGQKILASNEKELVAHTVGKLLSANGILKPDKLEALLRRELPQLKGKSLRAGINLGLKEKLYFRIKFKGFSPDKPARREKDYYSIIEEHWKSQGCLTQPQKGRLGIPDISAVRWVESRYIDEVELITTEVKRGRLSVNHLNQAYGYSKRAHRCYLASDDARKLKEFRGQAERLGIGLLYIDPETRTVTEKLSAPRSEPSVEPLMNHLADVFNLVQCAFCSVFLIRTKDTPVMKRFRASASGQHPSVLKRYVCNKCAELFPANTFGKRKVTS